MNSNDFVGFSVELAQLCSRHKETLSESDIKMYFQDVRDWSISDVIWSMKRHRKDAKQGMFFPQPAHLMKYLKSRPPENGTYNATTGKWVTHQHSDKALKYSNLEVINENKQNR